MSNCDCLRSRIGGETVSYQISLTFELFGVMGGRMSALAGVLLGVLFLWEDLEGVRQSKSSSSSSTMGDSL